MPTGYTADIYEGKEVSFPDFVMDCARAFGALITMRDDPRDAPIPDEFQPNDYHLREHETALRNLAEAKAWTEDQATEYAEVAYVEAHGAWVEHQLTAKERGERYEAMLAQVQAWEPPTPDHQGLKDFMVEQLESSIKHDADLTDLERWYPEPRQHTGPEWRQDRIAKAERDIEYHAAEWLKEVERAQQRTEWVWALRHSLGVSA